MDEAVAHEHNKPVFYKRDLIFTHLVVDKVEAGTPNTVYTVYYAGSCKYYISLLDFIFQVFIVIIDFDAG